jgi:hypothetical protein
VRVLASDLGGREALATEALLVDSVDDRAWSGFLEWLREEPVFGRTLPTWAPWVARILPAITLILFENQTPNDLESSAVNGPQRCETPGWCDSG